MGFRRRGSSEGEEQEGSVLSNNSSRMGLAQGSGQEEEASDRLLELNNNKLNPQDLGKEDYSDKTKRQACSVHRQRSVAATAVVLCKNHQRNLV